MPIPTHKPLTLNVGGFSRGQIMASSNTIEIIINAVDRATDIITGIGDRLQTIGSGITRVGVGMTAMLAPVAIGLSAATTQAVAFDEAMTNIQAVTQQTEDEMALLTDQVMDLGAASRYGPQAVAAAMYDIVGGVADATTHMDILEASISTAQAGNADLGATTAALISIMNSYSFSADQASFASDVLTQIVAKGVGTMDEFASALPLVSGLASSAGIEFDALGASIAFMTTKGYSASQSVTRLQSVISALLNPNERMTAALRTMGVESGSVALEMFGLAGTLDRLDQAFGGSQDAMAEALGSVEALQAAVVLGQDGFAEFEESFVSSLDGVTAAAEAVQMDSPAAQFDLLKSQISALAIEVGDALIPALRQIVDVVSPVIRSLIDWIDLNPNLTATIVTLAAAAAVAGPALMIVGQAVTGIGTIVRVAAIALGALLSPVGLIAAGAAGLATVLGVDVVGGFQAIIDQIGVFFGRLQNFDGDIGRTFESMFTLDEDGSSFFSTVLEGFGMAREQAQGTAATIERITQTFGRFFGALRAGVPAGDAIQTLLRDLLPADLADGIISTVEGIGAGIQDFLGRAAEFVSGTVLPALQRLADWFIQDALPAVVAFITGTVIPGVQRFFDFLGGVWEQVRPALETLADWFVNDALPAVVAFVTGTVIPGFERFVTFLQGVWEAVRPHLESLVTWFVTDGLPGIVTFVEQSIIPGIQNFINLLTGIWEAVQPALNTLVEWFQTDGLPIIQNFIQDAIDNFIRPLINIVSGIWEAVQPALQDLFDWFVTEGLPAIGDAVDAVLQNFILPIIDTLAGWWDTISGALGDVLRWFDSDGIPAIESAVQGLMDNFIRPLLDLLSGFWESVRPGIEAFRDGIASVFGWIQSNVIQPIIDVINGIRSAIDSLTGRATTLSQTDWSVPFTSEIFRGGGRTFATRDAGGFGMPNTPYLIGTGAQPELFVPRTAGTFLPNADQLGGITVEGDVFMIARVGDSLTDEESFEQMREQFIELMRRHRDGN